MTEDEGDLALEVRTQKTAYESDEEVVALVLLFNFGDDPVLVNSRLAIVGLPETSGEVRLEIVSPLGQTVPFTARVNIGRPTAEDFSTVVPWNCVGRRYELLSYFDLEETGRYTVTAVYRNIWTDPEEGSLAGGPAWTGELRSPAASFQVVSPGGSAS
jgi:hypothetical protein